MCNTWIEKIDEKIAFSSQINAVIDQIKWQNHWFDLGKIWEWEGSYRNDRVLDWDSWSFSMRFGNGEQVSTYGYMASPTSFREGIKEFLSLFEEKFAQTREKANELLETIGRRQS